LKINSKYKNVAKTASNNNLEIAILDSKNIAMTAEMEHKNFMETVNIDEITENYLVKLTLKIKKQQQNKFNQKLKHLKMKNEIPINHANPNPYKKKSKPRRFIPRKSYPKWKKVQSSKQNFELIHNFSNMKLSDDMISLLNKGPGFVPIEKTLNVTQSVADFDRYDRIMKWEEFLSHEGQEKGHSNTDVNTAMVNLEDDKELIQNVFKN